MTSGVSPFLPPDQYIASLARKRMAAGALFRDEDGRVLLVDPTYKPVWDLPGGAVEKEESARLGQLRVDGETGRACQQRQLAAPGMPTSSNASFRPANTRTRAATGTCSPGSTPRSPACTPRRPSDLPAQNSLNWLQRARQTQTW